MAYRYYIYKTNKILVDTHNKLAEEGKSKYYMAMNRFAATT